MQTACSSAVSALSIERSFISPKGSDLLTWEAGHSTLLGFLNIGLLNCSRFTVSIRPREQWRDVFENNPTMYFMVDAQGTVMAVNPFGAKQLGYNVNELVGQPALSFFY
jgi:PAS domain-containing protein